MDALKLTYRLFILFFVAVMVLIASGCRQEVAVPSFLIGTWKTASPKYEDRYIQFTQKTLVIGMGEDEEEEHVITKIKMEGKGGMRLYTFFYKDAEGDTWPFSILHHPHYNDGVLQLKNGQEVWTRIS